MFYYCESPIEHTLVASLLAIHARMSPLSLIIAPNFLHSPNPVQAFRGVCSDMQKFTDEIKTEDKRPQAFLEHIQACVDNNVIAPATFNYMRNHFLFYNLWDLSSAFHLNLQPAMKHIQMGGRTIRPDLLFWTPGDPQFRLIVECDGFDYHSDRDAFTRDRQRDRRLRLQRYDIIRFSGSEIYRNPVDTADELAGMLRKLRGEDENAE